MVMVRIRIRLAVMKVIGGTVRNRVSDDRQ